jgi:hypothetical protein
MRIADSPGVRATDVNLAGLARPLFAPKVNTPALRGGNQPASAERKSGAFLKCSAFIKEGFFWQCPVEN